MVIGQTMQVPQGCPEDHVDGMWHHTHINLTRIHQRKFHGDHCRKGVQDFDARGCVNVFSVSHISCCCCCFEYVVQKYGLFQPSVYHALIVIFLEFFSWGLVMSPVITVCTACPFLILLFNFSCSYVVIVSLFILVQCVT